MQKEEWLNARNKGKQEIANCLFKYYKEKGGKGTTDEFVMILQLANFEEMVGQLDREFEVVRVYNKEGNLIKVQ